MKKNISINISGIIFNIEEDGYERLKHYLDEIKRYFSSYEGSDEIAADIETRIAEIFLSKLSPQKQVISFEDVENLITQMGNVHDFEAIEEQEGPAYNSRANHETYSSANSTATEEIPYAEETEGGCSSKNRRFFRDGNRRVIGGVASGLGHYLKIDPIWVRILFLIILLDLFVTFTFSSALFIGYIITWIITPERFDLSTDKKIKKVFRDPESRVIGGVAGGLAAYFGLDPVILRILFVASFFLGGSGFFAYFVLWIVIPEARTVTDRMQMQGEPLTISNIEENLKKKLNLNDEEGKAQAARAVLLPFRLIASILESAGRAAGSLLLFLGNTIRVIAGIGIAGIGFLFVVALFVAGSFISGFIPELYLEAFDLQIPAYLAQKAVPPLLLLAAFFSLLIPGLCVILVGIDIIVKRWILPAAGAWLLVVLWIFSVVAVALMAPPYLVNYKVKNHFETSQVFASDSTKTLYIGLVKQDDFDYRDVNLAIEASKDQKLLLEKRFYARGKNLAEASEVAGKSQYTIVEKQDTILFSQHLHVPEQVPFRLQELNARLNIPVGQKFSLDPNIRKLLTQNQSTLIFLKNEFTKDAIFRFDESGNLHGNVDR